MLPLMGGVQADPVCQLRGIVGALQILPVALHQAAQSRLRLRAGGRFFVQSKQAAAGQNVLIAVFHFLASKPNDSIFIISAEGAAVNTKK